MTLRRALFVSGMAISAAASLQAQTISFAPRLAVFSAIARGPNPAPQIVRFANAGSAAASWRVTSIQRPWLTVITKNGTAPDSTTFSVSSAGMPRGSYTDTVRVKTGSATDTVVIPVVLVITDPVPGSGPGRASVTSYEIELSFIGYSGLVEAPNCVENERGYDRLAGMVSGVETTESDEDVVYVGTLRRETAIDFCETKGKDGPGDDERVMCSATLTGYAVTKVELTVYSDEGRGGWLKAAPAGGPMMRRVVGRCDSAEQSEMLSAYPTATDGGGGSPSGQPIDDAGGALVAGGAPRLRVGTYPPTDPKGGWTLRVIRKLP